VTWPAAPRKAFHIGSSPSKSMLSPWQEIGNRLRAYRLSKNFTAAELAEKIGVSRAALYRLEQGEVVKVETLERLANLLDVSLPALMGVGVEYYGNAVGFFERMRQLEANVTAISGNFNPISILLLSNDYITHLRTMLVEGLDPAQEPLRREFATYADRLLAILRERRRTAVQRKRSITSIAARRAIERFLRAGLVGRYDLDERTKYKRRVLARREIERIVELVRAQPTHVHIGLVDDFPAEQTFQVFDKKDKSFVTLSPYRLGDQPNISAGIALVTAAPEAVTMFKDTFQQQWRRAAKGAAAAKQLEDLLMQSKG
jgi:transcriptional regulator with XRE-family HTH domain